ncbi:MAG: M12 family metallo-peptidase [Tahibacter sp.]
MKRSLLWNSFVCVGVLGLQVATAQAGDLFGAAPLVLAPVETDAAYAALARDPSANTLSVVSVDASAVDENSGKISLTLDIGGATQLTAMRQSSYRNPDGSLVWQGVVADTTARGRVGADEITDDPMNSVMLVRNGDKVTGNVRVMGQLYKIRPLHDSRHVIVEVNEALMPVDHPADAYQAIFDASQAARKSASDVAPEAVAANTVIRVLVNYTQAVKSAVGDVAGLINLAVAESNQGYTNSDVSITMQLAGTGQVTYSETGNFDTDLARYRGTADGYMDSIHTQRNSTSADVGILLVNDTAYCGLASAIGATAATAFVAVYWDCATGYYSFAHEVGHLQSARHDPANDPTNSPYTYGHGYQYASGGWRTIMAYNCSSNCTRLNFWSNPGKTYQGHAMGTTTRSDNHRVLNNTRATVAAFR